MINWGSAKYIPNHVAKHDDINEPVIGSYNEPYKIVEFL